MVRLLVTRNVSSSSAGGSSCSAGRLTRIVLFQETVGGDAEASSAAREAVAHKDAVFTAIHRALMRSLLDLAETEGRTKIANMVRDIMKSLDEEGLRFVSAKGS
jgi:hypothetical protein